MVEELWREAQRFLDNNNNTAVRPDFSIPESFAHLDGRCRQHPLLELREHDNEKGKGWFAKTDIPAGTLVMVSKPLVHVMDDEPTTPLVVQENGNMALDDGAAEQALGVEAYEGDSEDGDDNMDEDEDEKDPYLNEILLIQLLQKLVEDPSVWETQQLNQLYPRNESEIDTLPPYVCSDDNILLKIDSLLQQLNDRKTNATFPTVAQLQARLPLILRYNVLSMETTPELLSYPSSPWTRLAGVGLYTTGPSFFNHSSLAPNTSRWSIGDVLFLVTNRPVAQGAELCLSYIEHDGLCEPAWRRNALLHLSRMDFADALEEDDDDDDDDDSPEYPVVDDDVQNELMGMDPLERLSAIEELLRQARGEQSLVETDDVGEAQEDGMEEPTKRAETWYHCDVQNLRILQAITLDGLGKTKEAFALWKASVEFVHEYLPPNDEALVPVAIQAALCALHGGDTAATAHQFAAQALATHTTMFGNSTTRAGGQVQWFRQRLHGDLHLTLRPAQQTAAAVDILWPLAT